MKFGETFMECRHGNEERFLEKCSHVEYKRLKKVLKSCSKTCATKRGSCPSSGQDDDDDGNRTWIRDFCQCEACPLCDQMFFSELMKEASEIAGFSSRADIYSIFILLLECKCTFYLYVDDSQMTKKQWYKRVR